MNRDTRISAFLGRNGYARAKAEPLAQDASFRRYLRLSRGPRPAILMDAPPPEDIRPFVRIADHLARIGASVPEIFAADEGEGLLLEEDLGDDLLSAFIDQASPCAHSLSRKGGVGWGGGATDHLTPLFDAAVDTLVAIQRATPPPDLPPWDASTMASTALATLCDWWWPAMFGTEPPAAARQDFAAALETTLAPVAAGPTCFVHRDFFAGNLIWLPNRSGIRQIGILDFQGAAIGHSAYDLVSLLQDNRRDIPPHLAEHSITRYLAARPDLDPAAFRAAYAACAAQRHLRIAGQWVRLARRDDRPGYLRYGPRTWHLLQQAVRQPAAAPLAAALDRWIPPHRRCNPPDLAA
jgi:aminoglycoside/choline kinase family phosphotransferase